MDCEICGKRKAVKKVFVEGAELWVCGVCGRGLEEVKEQNTSVQRIRRCRPEKTLEVVDNYAEKIRKARQGLNLSQEQLAKKLGITVNYLKHIEEGKMVPDEKTARKMEKILNITLLEEIVIGEEVAEREEGISLLNFADVEEE